MTPVVAAGSGAYFDERRNSSARRPAPPGSGRRLAEHLAQQRNSRWYREALQFAQAFNRRPLIDREPVPYNELPPGF